MTDVLLIALALGTTDHVTLRLEGEIVGPWVEELKTTCEREMARRTAVTLDLSGVAFIDRRGVGLVQGLRTRGIRLANCSPFVAEQLRA